MTTNDGDRVNESLRAILKSLKKVKEVDQTCYPTLSAFGKGYNTAITKCRKAIQHLNTNLK